MTLSTKELIASAKGCGWKGKERDDGAVECKKFAIDQKTGKPYKGQYEGLVTMAWPIVWNPAENAEQDRMCLKELLRRGYDVFYGEDNEHEIAPGTKYQLDGSRKCYIETCPAEEFAAKALAHIVEGEK